MTEPPEKGPAAPDPSEDLASEAKGDSPPAGRGGIVAFIARWWGRIGELPFWARETIRKLLHIGVVVLAVPLRWLDWKYGMLFAAVSLLWNSVGMPRYFHFTLREEEQQKGYSRGMLSYPIIVCVLMLLFPLPIAVSQWATLSFGDGFATLAGRFFGKKGLPWNKDKTYVGFTAFMVMGSLGAGFFFWLTAGNALGSSFIWEGSYLLPHIASLTGPEIALVCVLSTLAAAFFESLPIPYIDDNIAAPLAGATAKLALCFVV